ILMLGLGIGCLGGGWLASRRIPLAPLLALLAAASSALGFFSLALFERLGDLVAGLSPAAATGLTLGPALPPSTMMGPGLPLLVGHLAQRSNSVGAAAGLICFVTMLGAGAACLAAITLLFPFLGLQNTVNIAAALNAAIAAGALAAHAIDRRALASYTDETA